MIDSSPQICVHSPGRREDGTPSYNLGDVVIERAVTEELAGMGLVDDAVTYSSLHIPMTDAQRTFMKESQINILGGSNAVGWPWLRTRSSWKVQLRDLSAHLNFVMMGVGWSAYETRLNLKSRFYLRRLLHPSAMHSVRDRHTASQLQKLGYTNVVYTGCPTMWGFTDEYCAQLPQEKNDVVVTMVTDYRKNPERDRMMIDVLKSCYSEVVAFPQGTGDREYLASLGFQGRILDYNLNFVEDLRADYGTFDYVGTRLHGGIHCVQNGIRSLIVMIDNRAREIHRDTGLAAVEPTPEAIKAVVMGPIEQRITLPFEDIDKWRDALQALIKSDQSEG